jgi:hypothetical protein
LAPPVGSRTSEHDYARILLARDGPGDTDREWLLCATSDSAGSLFERTSRKMEVAGHLSNPRPDSEIESRYYGKPCLGWRGGDLSGCDVIRRRAGCPTRRPRSRPQQRLPHQH